MFHDIELICKQGVGTHNDCMAIGLALALWCEMSEAAEVNRQVRIKIDGGPFLTVPEQRAIWHTILPPDAVEDVLLDGHSWCRSNTEQQVGIAAPHQKSKNTENKNPATVATVRGQQRRCTDGL